MNIVDPQARLQAVVDRLLPAIQEAGPELVGQATSAARAYAAVVAFSSDACAAVKLMPVLDWLDELALAVDDVVKEATK